MLKTYLGPYREERPIGTPVKSRRRDLPADREGIRGRVAPGEHAGHLHLAISRLRALTSGYTFVLGSGAGHFRHTDEVHACEWKV
jgi:hypothetical protein